MSSAPEIGKYIKDFLETKPKFERHATEDSDPVWLFFDLAKYYSDSDETASRSDYSSSALTSGFATATTGASSVNSDLSFLTDLPEERNHREPFINDLAEAKNGDDHLVWPQPDPKETPPRSSSLQIPVIKKPSRRARSQGNGPRRLADRDETAQVRENGACIRCRIQKTKCSVEGVCDACRKSCRDDACIRNTLSILGAMPHATRSRYLRSTDEADQRLLKTKGRCLEKEFDVLVSFGGQSLRSPTLPIKLYQCAEISHNGNRQEYPDYVFVRDYVPSHSDLVSWIEQQMMYESHTTFEQGNEKFIKAYSQLSLVKHELLKKLHLMKCMYKLWKTDTLSCREPGSTTWIGLPALVQVELRQIAKMALESTERDVLCELDKYLVPKGIPDEERSPIWAGIWQLIMIYRDLLKTLERISSNPAEASPHVENVKMATKRLFLALVTFYGSNFRTYKRLQLSGDWLDKESSLSSGGRDALKELFETNLNACRNEFYCCIASGSLEVDKLLKKLVVDHEIKRLKNRRPCRKNRSPQGATLPTQSDDEDEDQDMMD